MAELDAHFVLVYALVPLFSNGKPRLCGHGYVIDCVIGGPFWVKFGKLWSNFGEIINDSSSDEIQETSCPFHFKSGEFGDPNNMFQFVVHGTLLQITGRLQSY